MKEITNHLGFDEIAFMDEHRRIVDQFQTMSSEQTISLSLGVRGKGGGGGGVTWREEYFCLDCCVLNRCNQ